MRGPDLGTTLPTLEIEHLYTQLGRAYELSADQEKAQAVYISMLAYARNSSLPALESAAMGHLALLVAQ